MSLKYIVFLYIQSIQSVYFIISFPNAIKMWLWPSKQRDNEVKGKVRGCAEILMEVKWVTGWFHTAKLEKDNSQGLHVTRREINGLSNSKRHKLKILEFKVFTFFSANVADLRRLRGFEPFQSWSQKRKIYLTLGKCLVNMSCRLIETSLQLNLGCIPLSGNVQE